MSQTLICKSSFRKPPQDKNRNIVYKMSNALIPLLLGLCGIGKEWWKSTNVRSNLICDRKFWHVEKEQMHGFGRRFAERVANIEFARWLLTLPLCFWFSHNVQENGCGCTLRKIFLGLIRERRPEHVANRWRRLQSASSTTAAGLYINRLRRRCTT